MQRDPQLFCARRMVHMLLLCAVGTFSSVFMLAQSRYPMRFLDDVGNLGNPYSRDKRSSADLAGLARVTRQDDILLFEGRDLAGKPWRLFTSGDGGVGWTEVWTADFDHNGRSDLLIGSHFPGNGRCVDGGDVLILLFEADGRPVPWMSSTMVPEGNKFPVRPAIVLDANGDGRAEIVTTSCEYADGQQRFGEDRRITGVYEARDARWVPLSGYALEPYRSAAVASHRLTSPGFVKWQPTKASDWSDQMSGIDAPATVKLNRILTGEVGCGGIRLTVGNGADDPCDVLRDDRAVYSDGGTRRGWPPAIIDGADGRDIYVVHIGDALRRIMRGDYSLRLLGGSAEPAWIWADARQSTIPSVLASELLTAQVTTRRLSVLEAGGEPASPFDLFVNSGSGCFAISLATNGGPVARHYSACSQLASLRRTGVSGPLRMKESMAWEIIARDRRLRTFRSDDGGLLAEYTFTPPDRGAELVNAVEFGQGFLVQWRVPSGAFVTLHDQQGRPLTDLMSTGTIQGDLLISSNSDGITFMTWKNYRPFELTECRMAVSWTRR